MSSITNSTFKIVFDSTKGSRLSEFSSSSQHKLHTGTSAEDGGGSVAQPIHPTLKSLTLASAVASCLFLNPLALACVLPAIYYTFFKQPSSQEALKNTQAAADNDQEAESDGGRIPDYAGRALFWNILSLLSYSVYIVAVLLVVFMTVGPLQHLVT